MPNPPNANTPLSAKPTRRFFDPWNSSSTGHQKADNRLAGSTSWRESRSLKLSAQFGGGAGGGRRVADTVGAGSEDFGCDGRLENGGWEKGALGLREKGQLSVVESFGGRSGVRKGGVRDVVGEKKVVVEEEEEEGLLGIPSAQPLRDEWTQAQARVQEATQKPAREPVQKSTQPRAQEPGHEKEHEHDTGTISKTPQIFSGVCVYINGSTAPLISDHRLKQLLVTHGAQLSLHLGRRSVTHVILGRPNGSPLTSGAGGGLASSKIQKEIAKIGGKNVKFVTAEWVVESVRNGKRAPESMFEAVRLAQKGTGRLGEMFAKAAKKV